MEELLFTLLKGFVGALVPVLMYFLRRTYAYIRMRNVRWLWHPFVDDTLSLMIAEYLPPEKGRFAKLARTRGVRHLISKGMALSLAHLLDFCQKSVTKRKDTIICGDRSSNLETDNMIILGSPAVNRNCKQLFDHLQKLYDLPFIFEWNDKVYDMPCDGSVWDDMETDIKIVTVSPYKTPFKPKYQDKLGNDYALVIKASYQKAPPKWVIIIAGCHMWGTRAATSAVTDARILNEVAKETGKAKNVTFIIGTRVFNDKDTGPDLDIDNRRYIRALTPKSITYDEHGKSSGNQMVSEALVPTLATREPEPISSQE